MSQRSRPDAVGLHDEAESPCAFSDGAEAFDFLGLLAFGFRNSLFDRFCPLAIQVSNSGSSGDAPARSAKRALLCQCCP
jgi:hypothetical protein